MTTKTVFLIGPGLIGWTVIDHLLALGYNDITTLVRRKEHGEQIKKVSSSSIKIVLGDLHDHELIAKNTAEHDITLHTATADDLPSAKAVLEGLKQRSEKGLESIYIHTSGASVLEDQSAGAYESDKIFRDDEPEDIEALRPDAPHRPIDLAISRFARELNDDKTKIAIMTPPLIYGYDPKKDRITIQIPALVRFALKHGYNPVIGAGKGLSGAIHVDDLARGFVTILKRLQEPDSAAEFRQNPYVFCENGVESSWYEVAEHVGKSLKDRGLLKDATPKEAPKETWGDLLGDGATAENLGMNSRARAIRLRKLGWESKEKGIWESFDQDELPAILRQQGKA